MARRSKPPTEPTSVDGLLASLRPPDPDTPPTPLPEDEPELVHLAEVPPEDPFLPGFMMSDDLDELDRRTDLREVGGPSSDLPGAPPSASSGNAVERVAPPVTSPQSVTAAPLEIPDDDIMPNFAAGLRTGVRYESRIRVLEAFQYPGNLRSAPEWVDRNWTGYASDYDPLRGIEPGPALRVPTRRGDEVVLCRPGDYVVKQEVVLAHGIEPDVVIDVWAKESFEKNFIPEPATGPTSSRPPTPARELSSHEA